jgi:hypothetical protein
MRTDRSQSAERPPRARRISAWASRLALLFCLQAAPTLLAEPAPPLPTQITAIDLEITIADSLWGSRKQWLSACRALGHALSLGKGPWGMGVFTSYSCVKGADELVEANTGDRPIWRMRLQDVDGTPTIIMDNGLATRSTTTLALAASSQPAQDLESPEVAQLVAFALLYRLPMAMLIDKKSVQMTKDGTSRMIRTYRPGRAGPPKLSLTEPKAPEELALYTLAWNGVRQLWQPKIAGLARRVQNSEQQAVYVVDARATQALERGPLWAHDPAGLETRPKELASAAQEGQRDYQAHVEETVAAKLRRSLLDTIASGYGGIRYGVEFVKGDRLIEKTSVFGLLVQIRGGPFKGLRYYYDKLPEVTSNETSVTGAPIETSITWARQQLGYSFDFNSPLLVDRITLAPKIGIWDFHTITEVQRDTEGRVVATREFEVVNALGLGAEVGVEWLTDHNTIQAWAGYERGIDLIKNGATVEATRGGINAFFTSGPHFEIAGVRFRLTYLVFLLGENVSLSDPKARREAAGDGAVADFRYSAAYAGAGTALSW